jgi:Xaa-Pro aminopeptidase
MLVFDRSNYKGLFNLRGKDIPYNPMFFGYALISGNQDNHRIYIEPERNTSSLTEYLKDGDVAVTIKNYQDVFKDLRQESADGKKIWASPLSSYAIYNSITNKVKNGLFQLK